MTAPTTSAGTARRWLRPALRALLTPVLGVLAIAAGIGAVFAIGVSLQWVGDLIAFDTWGLAALLLLLAVGILALIVVTGWDLAKKVIP